jgi:hypothetical protein
MEFRGPTAFVILPLLLVPFVGFGLAAIACGVFVAVGWGAQITPWLSYRFVAGLVFCELTAAVFAIAGNLLTGIPLVTGEFNYLTLGGLFLGIACLAICIVFAVLPMNVLAPFRVIYSGGPFVRIRGVHPEYLKGLPEFNPPESSDLVQAGIVDD